MLPVTSLFPMFLPIRPYNYVATAVSYQPATGQVVVGTTNVNMGDIIVNEMAYPPHSVVAQKLLISVMLPLPGNRNPNAQTITEGFEGTTFPPENWSQIITGYSTAGTKRCLANLSSWNYSS